METLYWHAFNQVVVTSNWKIKVGTYTSDFEKGMMNQLEEQFGGANGGTHVGCLFHFKQALRRHLIKKIRMDEGSVTAAMKIGSLDLLSVIPRDEVIEYGIPYLRSVLEAGKEKKTVAKWDVFWAYFNKTWIPIIESWNICIGDDEDIEIVNRTNNGLERYNRKFNGLFPKCCSIFTKSDLFCSIFFKFERVAALF